LARSTPSGRVRILIGCGLLVPVLYLTLSLRKVDEANRITVLDSPLLPLVPRVVPPGWRLAPPGLLRLTSYPSGTQSMAFALPRPGEGRLSTSEGVGVGVEGNLSYRVPEEAVLSLHRNSRGAVADQVVRPALAETLKATVRGKSYAGISGEHRLELESALALRLGPLLRARGILLLSARIDSVRVAGARAGKRAFRPVPGARLLLVGLDGADWKVVDYLLAQGKLPNLARLIREGVRARLKTIAPALSPVVWTTIATGFLPPEHGILDFLVDDAKTGRKIPVTSRQRKVRAVWNLLGEAGIPVGVVGWWATWPAESVNGYLVSDRVAYQLFGQTPVSDLSPQGKTHPPELFGRIAPLVTSPQAVTDQELARFIRTDPGAGESWSAQAESRLDEFRTVLAAARTYEGVALALASGRFQAFEAIYFEGIDTTSHLFMPFRPPRRGSVEDQDYRRFSGTVDAFYVYQDEVLGRLLEKAGPETSVLVLSDHGFRSDLDRPTGESRIAYATAASWHRKYGILILSGAPFKKGVVLSEVSAVDITPTILTLFGLPVGEDMQGRPVQDAFTPEFLHSHPVSYIATWEAARRSAPVEVADPVGDRALKERLLSLGYLSQQGSLASNNLGDSLLARGNVDAAIREFEKAVQAAPNLAVARINLGRAYMARGDFAGARRVLDEAERLAPDLTDAELLLASLDREEGRPEKAEARFRRVLAGNPFSAEAHKGLGLLYRLKGNLPRAVKEYEKAVEIDPEDAEAYNNIGVIRKEQGSPEEAEMEFRKAAEADPEFAGSYNNLALLAMDRGDWGQAETFLAQARDRTPADPTVHNNLGNLFFRQGRMTEAEREFRQALEVRKDYPEAHNGLGAVLGRRGNRESELEEYRRAIALNPRYLDARLNLSEALRRRGNLKEAEEELGRILALFPGHLQTAIVLVQVLTDRSRPADALRVAREATRANPRSAAAWSLLGEVCLRTGDRTGARAAFRNSLSWDPQQSDVRRKLESMEGSKN
jgi:Flp pilus assembly protein TadD/predicted AlkP superfamily phosphohydrolase/phosphomutase